MNKKEIAEIKKQLTPANCAITRICGCYVNAQKEKVTTFAQPFLSLPDEEMYKYFDLLRKVLSGTPGKNLLNMEYSLRDEMRAMGSEAADGVAGEIADGVAGEVADGVAGEVADGVAGEVADEAAGEAGDEPAADSPQSLLLALRECACKDEALLDTYYDRIVEAYTSSEHYLILLVCASYDVPGKATDETVMDDASDEVYSFLLSCICPVSLAKPALSYDVKENRFGTRVRDWIVDMPTLGFLFPAFNDRRSDIHSLLYYTKNADELHFDFTDRMLGCTLPMPASDQKEVFVSLVENALGENCVYEVVQNLHEQIHDLAAQQKDNPDPLLLSGSEMHNLLEFSGADKEQLTRFDEAFEETCKDADGAPVRFLASNITGTRRFEVKTPDVVIQVSPDRADLVEQRVIDGRPCLVIPITDQVHVNGIRVVPSHVEN